MGWVGTFFALRLTSLVAVLTPGYMNTKKKNWLLDFFSLHPLPLLFFWAEPITTTISDSGVREIQFFWLL